MASLSEIRKNYPQYDDLSDQQLADALYTKHYSDMDRNEFYSKIGLLSQEAPQSQEQPKQELSIGDRAKDIGQSAFTGLGQGEVGLITGPLDIGMMAGGYAAKKAVGKNDFGVTPESTAGKLLERTFGTGQEETGLPLEPPSLSGLVNEALNLAYNPKTTAGDYVQTGASFIPAFAGAAKQQGTNVVNRYKDAIKKAAITGTTSEAAGQLTEGTELEPAARVAGAILPGIVGKAASPQVKDPTKLKAMQIAEDAEIPVYRYQVSDSAPTKMAASFMKDVPLSGAQGRIAKQVKAFHQRVLNEMGVTGDAVTPEALTQADNQISKVMNDAAKTNNLLGTQDFVQKVQDLTEHAEMNLIEGTPQHGAFALQVKNLMGGLREGTGVLSGKAYQNLRSGIGRMLRANNTFSPELAQLQDLMDGQFISRMPQKEAKILQQARQQYRTMIAVEKVVKNNPNELFSPAKLQGAVNSVYKNYAYAGPDSFPIENLARTGNLLKDTFPSSGTAQRLTAADIAKKVLSVGSMEAAGGALGTAAGGPLSTLLGIGAPIAASRWMLTPYLYQKMGLKPGYLEQILPQAAPALPYQFVRGQP